jgi:hypothetical protein
MSSRGKQKKEWRSKRIANLLNQQRARLDEMEASLAESLSRKTVVYLDTNHWVHMQSVILERSTAKLEYREILTLLGRLVDGGTICCPVSSSLFEELMKQSDPQTRRLTSRLMDRLSQRVCLQFLLRVACREWRHNVHQVINGEGQQRSFSVWTNAGFWAGQDEFLRDLSYWSVHSDDAPARWIDLMWAMGFEQIQELPGFTPLPDEMVSKFVQSMNDSAARSEASRLSFDQLRSREKMGLFNAVKNDFFKEPLPKLGPLPTAIFSAFIDEHDPWVLSSLQIYAGISAAVMKSNRKIGPHDILDFMHAASAIPYSDAYFCDKAMANLLTGIPLHFDEAYKTTISSKPEEIIAFLKQLA